MVDHLLFSSGVTHSPIIYDFLTIMCLFLEVSPS